VAEWLSFWNAETRQRNRASLHSRPVGSIYIPYGWERIKKGDVVSCVGIDGGGLQMITRLKAVTIRRSRVDPEEVIVKDPKPVKADYERKVPKQVLRSIDYLHVDRSEHPLAGSSGVVEYARFQGRNSLRELRRDASKLDAYIT
jgi:hypothetical protein